MPNQSVWPVIDFVAEIHRPACCMSTSRISRGVQLTACCLLLTGWCDHCHYYHFCAVATGCLQHSLYLVTGRWVAENETRITNFAWDSFAHTASPQHYLCLQLCNSLAHCSSLCYNSSHDITLQGIQRQPLSVHDVDMPLPANSGVHTRRRDRGSSGDNAGRESGVRATWRNWRNVLFRGNILRRQPPEGDIGW